MSLNEQASPSGTLYELNSQSLSNSNSQTLSPTNMYKNTEQRENKEVSRMVSHSKQRITYSWLGKNAALSLENQIPTTKVPTD